MKRGGFVRKARCPKCGGNIYVDNDIEGWYEECLQCGHTTELMEVKPQKTAIKITGKD